MIDERLRTGPEPRVTIAVPCFKQEVFLFECLNSLIAQTMPSWQAFVVDDCSPAATAHWIVTSYGDSRIHCIRHDSNRGPAAAKNTGLQAGDAPFALYLDADDFIHPEFLSATLEAIEGRGTDCVYTEFQNVGLSNEVWFTQDPKSASELAQYQWLPGPGVMMRRSVWEAAGGYSTDLRFNEDWDFWIAAMELGVSVARVPRPFYYYRRHAHSLTATQGDNDRITRELILKKRPAFFAVGDRARTFRAGGLLASARAHSVLGHRWQSLELAARAVAINPTLIFSESKSAIRRRLRLVRRIGRQLKSKFDRIGQKELANSKTDGHNSTKSNLLRDWDALAPAIHNQYGYLSHDYSLLGQVIDKTGARFLLEVGCGSGRLVPVYLMHNAQTIWLQDVSGRALDLCRQRFFRQGQIRYFRGSVQSIPMSTEVDLIVANRVFQHILDDAEFAETLAHLATMTRYFYVNECGIEDAIRLRDPNVKGRDYAHIFRGLGWRVTEQGKLTAEFDSQQSWTLFAKEGKACRAWSMDQGTRTLNVQHPK